MYKVKYTVNMDEKGNKSLKLEAEFKFGKEIPKGDYLDVRDIIENTTRYSDRDIRNYIKKKTGATLVNPSTNPQEYGNVKDTDSILRISVNVFSPGFDLDLQAKNIPKSLSIEEMIDLDDLNRFILNKGKFEDKK